MGRSITVRRISYCIHPLCWTGAWRHCAQRLPPGSDPLHFAHCLDWERRVRVLQDAYLQALGEDEALVLYPIGDSPEMLELERLAEDTLGPRCVVLRDSPFSAEGTYAQLPAAMRAALADEIVATFDSSGFTWSAGGLKVAFGNRVYAHQIGMQFRSQGVRWDPATVEGVAFGEGFEECAMTWKAMVPHHLGLARPIENDFTLSVSGAAVLFGARFVERVALDGDRRLFLWEGADGRPIGLLTRAACRLADRQQWVHLDVGKDAWLEVWQMPFRRVWPAEGPAPTLRPTADSLQVAVFAGTRKTPTDAPCYLVGTSLDLDEFRRRLVTAPISE